MPKLTRLPHDTLTTTILIDPPIITLSFLRLDSTNITYTPSEFDVRPESQINAPTFANGLQRDRFSKLPNLKSLYPFIVTFFNLPKIQTAKFRK